MNNNVTGKNLTQLSQMLKTTTGNGLGTAAGNGWVDPKAPNVSDLLSAIDWLLMHEWEENTESGKAYINVAEMLSGIVLKQLKKDYAKANNIKMSQVKFVEVA